MDVYKHLSVAHVDFVLATHARAGRKLILKPAAVHEIEKMLASESDTQLEFKYFTIVGSLLTYPEEFIPMSVFTDVMLDLRLAISSL